MIYITVALGIEGKKIIEYYGLRRDNEIKKFQVFKNDEITLVITGVGMLNALAGTVFVLSQSDGNEEMLLNIGVAGAKDEQKYRIGDSVLVNKVLDRNNRVVFYPDMVFKHPFKEGCLETFSHIVKKDENIIGDIVDMEGAGVVKGGSIFLDTSRIHVIKIVSDHLDGNIGDIEGLIEKELPLIDSWIKKIKEIAYREEILNSQEIDRIKRFSEEMKFTQSMINELKSLMEYYKLCGQSIDNLLGKYKNIQIVRKNEVKKIFDEIRETVIK